MIFKSLGREDMKAIVELELRNLSKRLSEQDLTFNISEPAKSFLIEKGYDEKYGARPLRRAIETHFEDVLAEAILSGSIKAGEVIEVNVKDEHLVFEQNQAISDAAGL